MAFGGALGDIFNQVNTSGGPVDLSGKKGYVSPAKGASSGFSFSNLGSSILHGAASVGKSLITGLAGPAIGTGQDISSVIQARQVNQQTSQAVDQLLQQQRQYGQQYRLGQISSPRYSALMKDISTQLQAVQSNSDKSINLPSKTKVVSDVLGTAATPLAFGKLTGVAKEGTALARAEAALGASSRESDVYQLAHQSAGQAAKAALKAPIKNALLEQPTVQAATTSAQQASHGNLKPAAENALLVAGIPIVGKYLPKAVGAVKDAVFGSQGILDGVFGTRVGQFLAENPQYADVAKQMQQFTKNHVGGSTEEGINFLKEHLNTIGVDPQSADLGKEFDRAQSYFNERGRLQARLDATPEQNQNLVIGHDVKGAVNKVLYRVGQYAKNINLLDAGQRQQMTDRIINELGVRNTTLEDKLRSALGNGSTVQEIRDSVRQIEAKPGFKLPGFRPAKGFIVTPGPKTGVVRLPTVSEAGPLELGQSAKIPAIGSALTKAGLSPNAVSNRDIRSVVQQNFTNEVNKITDLPESSGDIYKRLNTAAYERGITDPRLLYPHEFNNLLGHSYKPAQMKAVRAAINNAYAKLPVAKVGMANWLVNQAIKDLPLVESSYLRIQGMLRYGINPFFYGRVLTKSTILAAFHGTLPIGSVDQATLQALQERGYFAKAISDLATTDFLGTSFTSEDVKASMAQIRGAQQKIVGRMAETIAAKNGTTVEKILQTEGPLHDELDHAIRTVVAYPQGGYINSPLARTLNVLIFPSRFETKVLMAAGKAMSKMPPMAQALLVTDLARGAQWLGSPAGKAWQQQNSELVGIINYFTPTQSIVKTLDSVSGGGGVHLADLGEVGGLPFGVISIILQHQGINVGSAGEGTYLDPKTGQVVPEYIPTTVKTRLQQGLSDLLGSMFGWPGKDLGLPSKTGIDRALTGSKVPGPGFQKVTPPQPVGTTPTAAPATPLPALNDATPVLTPLPKLSQSQITTQPLVTSSSKRAKAAKRSKVIPVADRVQR